VTTAELIGARFAGWGFVPAIVSEVFEDPSPDAIAEALDAFCATRLGARVAQPEFFEASVGSVHGLTLEDGRRVVVKVTSARRPRAFLEAMQSVQRRLAAARFPAPLPLAAPARLGRGIATAESLLDTGDHPDGRDPAVRRTMAAGLAAVVDRCRALGAPEALQHSPIGPSRTMGIWPEPHDARFDFAGTRAGAEWIDEIARRALDVLRSDAGERVVGHGDWRAEHLRFADGRLSAVYDWDSLRIASEAAHAGSAAHAFAANWRIDQRQLPTAGEARAFIEDYEAARGRPFSAPERAVANASLVYTMGYTARCQHSDAVTGFATGPSNAGSAADFLADHAGELLRRYS